MMGPLAGIIVSDYYLVRKQRLDVRELYKDHGIYWYGCGVNWRAFVSFAVGFLPTLPGLVRSVGGTEVGGAWKVCRFLGAPPLLLFLLFWGEEEGCRCADGAPPHGSIWADRVCHVVSPA